MIEQLATVAIAIGNYLVWRRFVGVEQGLAVVIALGPYFMMNNKVRREP